MAEEEDQVKPSRLMTRDMGILVDRVFSYGVGKYAQSRNPDNIDIETYRGMKLDSQISAGLNCMVLATIGNGWEFNFKDENDTEQVDFVRRAYAGINQMPGKRGSLFEVFREVLSALWAGFSVTEKVWKQDSNGKWVISRYKVLPPETVEFKVDKQGRLSKSSAVVQNPNARNSVILPARKVNVFTINGDYGNPYGTSILKPVHRTWYVKDWLLKFHSMFLENMGSPFWVGKTNRDTADMNAALQDAKQSAVITLGEGEDVSILETTQSGQAFLDAIRYHDGQIMRGMLVPSLLTGQDETYGSRALSEVQFEMFKLSRIGALQTQLQSWINHDIREMIQLNFGKQESYPELSFRSWSRADMTKMSRMIGDLITARVVTPDESWIRQFLELPERDPSLDPITPEEPEGTVDKTPLPGDRKTEVAPRAPGEDAVVSKNEEVDVDVFTTEEEAYARAQEIGCDQVHSHTSEDGATVYMPCKTHDEYTEKVDEDLAKKKKKYYELETYQPPSGAQGNAKKVLRWKKEHGSEVKGMTSTGWARARQLASGVKVSRRTVARMSAFNRHRKNAKINPEFKSTPWKDNGYVAWLGWGGNSGINWAISKMKSIKSKGLEAVADEDLYDDLEENWYGEEAYELTSAEIIPMGMSQGRKDSSNITYQKELPSATEGTPRANILDFGQSNYKSSKPAAYDERADPSLLRILKRGGKALTPTEVDLLNARETALEKGEDKFRWLGEINGHN